MDTGATRHYVTSKLATPAIHCHPVSVSQPDGSELVSTSSTTLPVPHNSLPTTAIQAQIIPSLSESLVSIGKFCDEGCVALFDKDKARVFKGPQTQHWLSTIPTSETILSGDRDSTDSLWH